MLHLFNKTEIKYLLIIFTFLILVTGINIKTSLRKGRDTTRKNDMSAMQKEVDTFLQKYKEFPKSTIDGRIIGCFIENPVVDNETSHALNAVACDWGVSKFENINVINNDPSYRKGRKYLYISDGDKYEIYVSLEGKNEDEYSLTIIQKNLHCGDFICNYGRWGS
ncbi:hypothetical protein A2130_00670 [Candidatus Woesebacteria bacterium GWC2_33_12]|nr:MAG: hypothetical protein A2130_00670 [Candidatus Woesebacteria bacterium GWC2_33_12]OGM80319.1 MAG: hypothetical protein A2366_02910 [Candidatus Woesebacteria bacterium RIFOXYB1_FULL_33_9]HCR35783.1 hypothetical protein [Candidatus Woesebacteria bacterium]